MLPKPKERKNIAEKKNKECNIKQQGNERKYKWNEIKTAAWFSLFSFTYYC